MSEHVIADKIDAAIAAAGHDDHAHDEHPEMNIAMIGGCLGALTLATFGSMFVAEVLPLWGHVTNALFVLAVAFCKATFVVGFFMHFNYEKNWKWALCIPPCVLAVAAVCAWMPDIAHHTYERVSWKP